MSVIDEFDAFIPCQIRQLAIKAEGILERDPELGKILKLLESGQNLAHHEYKAPESKYSLSGNCLIFEYRVVLPFSLRQCILSDLHAPT